MVQVHAVADHGQQTKDRAHHRNDMSDTPETDALVNSINSDPNIIRREYDFVEMMSLARKLERERDEARKLAHTFRLLYYTQLGIDANTKQLPWEEVTK
jgi:hypothetical protein